jgi:dienelactone hydrolase family protein
MADEQPTTGIRRHHEAQLREDVDRGQRRIERRRAGLGDRNRRRVKTPDGTCDAVSVHRATGAQPGVLIWPDAFGRRPSMHGFATRIAAEGYSVLVSKPFYRTARRRCSKTHRRFVVSAFRRTIDGTDDL